MNDLPLLNPNGQLLPEIAARMFETRKTKPIWAKRIETKREVETIEGRLVAGPDDYLCRGIVGEYWPQKQSKLLEKYVSSDEVDSEGWRRFDPKPESAPVEAAQLATTFRVTAHWGELTGKANDFVVRSKTDPTDIWIVEKAIFEASYEPTMELPTLNTSSGKMAFLEQDAKDASTQETDQGEAIANRKFGAIELNDLLEENRSDDIAGSSE